MDTKNLMNELVVSGKGVASGIVVASDTECPVQEMLQDALRRPTEQREAALGLIYETIVNTYPSDPLGQLQARLGLYQHITTSLASDLSALSICGTKDATQRMAQGKEVRLSKDTSRAITSLMHVMEGSAKLGVAQVKVADEISRRSRTR